MSKKEEDKQNLPDVMDFLDDEDIDVTPSGQVAQHFAGYRKTIGSAAPMRGNYHERRIVSLDAIPLCTEESCRLRQSGRCTYKMTKQNTRNESVCVMIHRYAMHMMKSLYSKYEGLQDDNDFDKVGTFLIPNYILLYRIHLETIDSNLVNMTKSGPKSNPLLKEKQNLERVIREWHMFLDQKLNIDTKREGNTKLKDYSSRLA